MIVVDVKMECKLVDCYCKRYTIYCQNHAHYLSKYRVKPEIGCTANKLHNMKGLPIYAQPTKMLSIQDVVGILLSSKLEDTSICSQVPFSVEVNAVFVIDLNKLSSPNDVTCDDMGVWTWGGSKKRWVSVDDDGDVAFLRESNQPGSDASHYFVWKRYYSHKSSPDLKKMIIILEGMYDDK